RRVYRLHERLVAIRTEYNLRLKSGAPQAAPAPLGQRPRLELDDVTLRYLQDLLAWVEENQRRLAAAEWGMDLPTVESHLGSHRGLHQSIEEFRAKIERARADEDMGGDGCLSAWNWGHGGGRFGEPRAGRSPLPPRSQNSSKSRLRHLESLHGFVSAATKELMWLDEKEEEEVNFDWSDGNPNMAAKKDNYS
ncbi:PLEC protein, partial [Crypturellus undulatus]|nr:PLEC protein [Crypturellus undulatus]